MNLALKNQLRKDSKELDSILSTDDHRNLYNNFVLGASEELWGKKLPNGKRFDANNTLSLYEYVTSLDQRVIQQYVETSQLRANFKNFPSERLFQEYTGIEPTSLVYIPTQLEITGTDTTSPNKSSKIKTWNNPSEIKKIKAARSPIRRDVFTYKEGFEITLEDVEMAAVNRLPLQESLTQRVIRDLMMQEQDFAFNYVPNGAYNAPESYGLFGNTAIPTSTWTAGDILAPGTSGRAIINEFVRIKGLIVAATKQEFQNRNYKLCVIVSPEIENQFDTTYSDLDGKDVLGYLTTREFRIKGIPSIPKNVAYFYYGNSDIIEISSAGPVTPQPQSYDANTTSWFFPFRIVTAGLTTKVPQGVYKITGLSP
jgi:hypothetical protein